MVATSSSADSISDTISSPSNVLSSIARTLKHRMDPDVVVGMKVTDPSVIVISEESSYEGMKHILTTLLGIWPIGGSLESALAGP